MVSSAELKLRRAMSYGELCGGRDPAPDSYFTQLSSQVSTGGVPMDFPFCHDENQNVQIKMPLKSKPPQRSNSLVQLNEATDKGRKKPQPGSFWRIIGKRKKMGITRLVSTDRYKIEGSYTASSRGDKETCDGRYVASGLVEGSKSSGAQSECYSRHTSKDSGFSSEVDSIPSTPASSINGDRLPGVSGLYNLGNTCYINAVVQCLAHIDAFVEYFAMDKHEKDSIGKRKSKKMDGQVISCVTEKLAVLLKSLWSFGYSKELSEDFKEVVGHCNEQYTGSVQHDAQEFLLWLLNVLNEDLGKSTKKKFGKTVSLKKKRHYSEEELALMALASHTHSSGSFIQDLFQAQYKSSLYCPNCGKNSSTFDPFLCISLPIPQPDSRPYYVTVVHNERHKNALRIGVIVPLSGNVSDIRVEVSRVSGIPDKRLILFKMKDNGEQQCLKKDSSSSVAQTQDEIIFAVEEPKLDVLRPPKRYGAERDEPELEGSALTQIEEMEASSIIVIVTNVEVKGNRCRRFANPFALRVARDVSFRDLQLLIRREMTAEIREAFNKEARVSKLAVGLRVVDGTSSKEYLNADTTLPLFLPSVQRAEESSGSCGYRHVCLIAEWESVRGEWCFAKFGRGSSIADPSVGLVEAEFAKAQVVNLKECIKLHTKEEELQCEDCWKCPNCKKELQKATKTLMLWSLPDVLVFHLKRFQQQGNNWKGKVSSLVDFPLENLDMSPHVAQRTRLSPRMVRRYSSRKKLRYQPPPKQEDCLYDLVAVCNHVGPYITSGHYTAHCKNSVDRNWYLFDDLNARTVPEEQVLTKSAYLLFYQRRTGLSRALSVTSLPNSGNHWSLRIPLLTQRHSLHLDLETSIAMLAKQELQCASDR